MEELKGKILVAHPFLKDPNFKRTVVLICEESEDGHYGLILNNPITGVDLEDVLSEELGWHQPLLSGGPVEPMTLQYLHHENIKDALMLSPDLCIGGDFNEVKELLNLGEISSDEIKFFLGYSGWGGGQLEDELEKESWLITDFKKEYLDAEEDLWKQVLRDMGGDYAQLINYPIDPRLN